MLSKCNVNIDIFDTVFNKNQNMFKSILRQNKFQKCLKLSNIKCNNELLMNSKNNRNKISSIISSNYCHNEQNRSQTHFGFESVTNEEKFRRGLKLN